MHERWDLRFSSITYLPRSKGEPQRFLYSTHLGFGLQIKGAGESGGEAIGADGSRSSALRLRSEDPKSLIREGAGSWKYLPDKCGVTFLTRYNYRVRFGGAGRLLDGMLFRPLMQWATACHRRLLCATVRSCAGPRGGDGGMDLSRLGALAAGSPYKNLAKCDGSTRRCRVLMRAIQPSPMSDHFPTSPIRYEGPDSTNLLAFKQYDPTALVEGKSMKDHLRFGAAYWHCMRNGLADPFGAATALMPWDDGTDDEANVLRRVDVFFEFLQKIGIEYYCFHDRDVSPERETIRETEAQFDRVIARLAEKQKETGRKLLWGTACLFAHPRYAQGAGTSPELGVFTFAAAQIKKAIEATHQLGGEGYTFWGGREGYSTLLNTDLKRERDHLAALLHLAVNHKKAIGFQGAFYIEPKPQEPTTHQYDSDAEACLNFLREFGLMDEFKLNLETNHATLAGHTMVHEIRAARAAGALGSVDANQGTANCGWDTDEFPTDLYLTTGIMLEVLEMGGFTTGGLNFDAKRRRDSFEPLDLFHAHIAGMDAFAAGLKVASAIRKDGRISQFISERYSSWDSDLGRRIESGQASLEELHRIALESPAPSVKPGRQEILEGIVNQILRRQS